MGCQLALTVTVRLRRRISFGSQFQKPEYIAAGRGWRDKTKASGQERVSSCWAQSIWVPILQHAAAPIQRLSSLPRPLSSPLGVCFTNLVTSQTSQVKIEINYHVVGEPSLP